MIYLKIISNTAVYARAVLIKPFLPPDSYPALLVFALNSWIGIGHTEECST
jgi:hypothetical protein